MNALESALAVLTAMITPAVLISACGALILSTSTRAGRVNDRVRALIDRFEELAHNQDIDLYEQRRAAIFEQLDMLTSRSRLLQRSLTVFYFALGVFIFTSVAIGLVSFLGSQMAWIPIIAALIAAAFLLYGSVLLILEARLALSTTRIEMDFIWQLSKHYAPRELVQQTRPQASFLPFQFRRKERKRNLRAKFRSKSFDETKPAKEGGSPSRTKL